MSSEKYKGNIIKIAGDVYVETDIVSVESYIIQCPRCFSDYSWTIDEPEWSLAEHNYGKEFVLYRCA